MTIKILVTGGTGLVGHGIQHGLRQDERLSEGEEWIFVGSKDADLTKSEEAIALFEKYKPNYVVHLASIMGGLHRNNLNFFITNTLININVLNCCRRYNVKKIFSCLSTCVFDMNDKLPYTEKSSINGDVHDSNCGYALSKRNIIILNKLFNETQSECLFTSFIPCNIFGPHDNFKVRESRFIPSLVRRMYEAECERTPLVINGNGSAKRQFIYSRDLGKLIIWLVKNYNDPETIILSPDYNEECTISEIVNKTASAFNFSQNIEYDPNKNNGMISRTVSNKKLQQLLSSLPSVKHWSGSIHETNNFEFTPYEDAISETMNWFIENNKN